MKSRSSVTLLPETGLYSLSNISFMMRVGGQSGTAMWSTTSSADALMAPPKVMKLTKPRAVARLFSLVLLFISCFLPLFNGLLRLTACFSSPASGHDLATGGAEDVNIVCIDDNGGGIADLDGCGLRLGQHHAQRFPARQDGNNGDITQRFEQSDFRLDGFLAAAS